MTFEALKTNLRDAAFTTPTPFSADGDAVRHDALADNLRFLRDAGAGVVIPNGNTGEYYSLSHEERVAVVETTVETVGDDLTVVAGLGGSTKTALSLLSAYEDAGVDGVMVMYPAHTYLHEEGVADYYRCIADATDLGVVLYKRGPRLSVENVATLTAIENVVAVKFAQNDVNLFARAVAESEGDVVWSVGIAERFVPSFAAEGADAFTTGIGNFVPGAVLALMDAIRDGDLDRARHVRDVLRPYEELREEPGAGNHMSAGNNVPAVKYGLELAGQYGGPVREPLVDLAERDRERCESYYERILELDV
ncbi:dihydrodipicolinate synthase family protein [Salinigranum salinum]|uniref:dihydrodipicolinate synthase family protein n=1 Tax=Salinigranum salinum TaxID=1364937 RepID=UPI001260BC64|nr:dihydrodipicolinate synthase family protein [Salinigranum salinum]